MKSYKYFAVFLDVPLNVLSQWDIRFDSKVLENSDVHGDKLKLPVV